MSPSRSAGIRPTKSAIDRACPAARTRETFKSLVRGTRGVSLPISGLHHAGMPCQTGLLAWVVALNPENPASRAMVPSPDGLGSGV
jgi:hypothetical protein